MIVESLYLLMGKKKSSPNKFAIYEIKDLVMKKTDHKFIFSEDTIHVASPISKKKNPSGFFFLLYFSPPKIDPPTIAIAIWKMNSIKTNYNFHVLGAPYYYEQKKKTIRWCRYWNINRCFPVFLIDKM